MINQSLTKQKYSFDVRAGTTTPDEAVTSIDCTVIAYNLDQVIDWCKGDYISEVMEEITGDELNVFYEYSYNARMSDHGNIIETDDQPELNQFDEPIGEIFYARDVCDISGSELSDSDYKYMTSDKYHNTVIDLTEDN